MAMKNHFKLPLVVLSFSVLIALAILIIPTGNDTPAIPVTQSERELSSKLHSSYSKDADLYGINSTDSIEQKFSVPVYGGIVSHHLLANIDIAKFFYEFSDQDVERVILIGPNHFYPTSYPALTTTYDYETPFGSVKLDTEYIAGLVSANLVKIDEETLETEHAISSLVPYIAHYLPEAQLVPIILTHSTPELLQKQISDFLKNNNSEKTIVVASVDFSHHLYSNSAALHDLRSVSAIKNFDVNNLPKLEIDSPQSIGVLLRYLDAIGADDISLWQQNAAAIFDEYDIEDVTSYVFAHAQRGEATKTSGVSALFFGDTMLGRGVAERLNNEIDLFAGIRGPEGNFLKGYDAIAINLEGAIASEVCGATDDELLIEPDNLAILVKNNISHAGIKNNHFQKCEVAQSVQLVQEIGIETLNDSSIIEGTNTSIAVFSVYAAPVPADTSAIVEDVRKFAEENQNVVVNIHWGVEYSTEPTTAQRELARDLIDAGADIIIGHHPHVVQSVEKFNDGLIIYSLGNFISDQEGERTKTGLAAGVFFGDATKKIFLFPFEQTNGVPTHLTQEKSGQLCEDIIENSDSNTPHSCVVELPN